MKKKEDMKLRDRCDLCARERYSNMVVGGYDKLNIIQMFKLSNNKIIILKCKKSGSADLE